MFDIINDIINHSSQSSFSEEIILSGCVVLIIVFCVATVDLISQFIHTFTRIK